MAAEKPEARQIFNMNILLAFSAGNQQLETQVNVPFVVKKMILHPPRHNQRNVNVAMVLDAPALAAATAPLIPTATNVVIDQYLLYSSLNKGSGIIGMIDTAQTGVQSEAITVIFDNQQQINGYHKFWTRSFTEAAGGAKTDLTAKVWQHIEFHNMI